MNFIDLVTEDEFVQVALKNAVGNPSDIQIHSLRFFYNSMKYCDVEVIGFVDFCNLYFMLVQGWRMRDSYNHIKVWLNTDPADRNQSKEALRSVNLERLQNLQFMQLFWDELNLVASQREKGVPTILDDPVVV